MSDCKCKAVLNIIPKCDPTLDIKPNCPVVLDVATTQRGAPGKDATINGVNTLFIETTDGISYTQSDETLTLSGQGLVAKTETASQVYGTDDEGNQTTYDVDSFGQVDDVQVGGVSVVTNKIAQLGTMASETASDYSTTAEANNLYAGIAYEQTIDNHIADKNNPHAVTKAQVGLGNCDNTSDLDKPVSTATQTALNGKQDTISDLSTIRENATHGESAYNTISGYGDIVTHDVDEFATSAQGALADTALQPNDNISELTNNLNYQTATQVANSISVETNNRESADNNLQSQIDAIVSSSDVFDIVGTYAELQAYDISTVPVNDIIKVLVDSTHSGAATYYRCVETGGVKSWSYIGSEGAYYTKAEADSNFVPQTRTVNNKALSSDITLTASDVGALPSSTVIPTVNDATVTIQKNGNTVSTFTLNQLSNETVNLTVPTATSDLNNDSGFITSADLPTNYVTTDTAQDISAKKTFLGEKAILFKQTASTDKLGFTLYTSSNSELGAFEYRPNTISGSALLNVNCSYSASAYVGFRYWGTDVNIIAPKVATAGSYYIPVNITDGNTTVTAGSNGTVNISSLLPSSAVWGNIRGDLSNQTDLQNALDEKADVLKVNVADIVSTYADLQSYDTSNVTPNSIIKVIADETNGGKTSWYKWDIQGSETPFVQPVLSANGTIGGDSFACSSSSVYQSREPWYAFDGVTKINSTSSNEYHCENVSGSWLMFYNPEPLAVTKIEIYNGNVRVVDWEFQCSDDNANWRTLASGTNTDNQAESMWSFNVSSSGFHRYYRFVGMNGTYLNYWSVLEMKITGVVSAGYGWLKANEEGKYATETWVGNQGYLTGINSSDVTTALGYTPVNPSSLATVATTGDYDDLLDKPTLGTMAAENASDYTKTSGLATVATSGSYNDLSNKPTIPAAQVNADWNASSGVAQILNKPTIPTVNNATLTIQKNGTTVKTFTANASSNVTANITVPTNTNELTNGAGFITGISSSDVTTALGYTPANDSNAVHKTGNENIAGIKTFIEQIKATLASYSATSGSTNTKPYKKIGSCVLTGTYQSVVIPFLYSKTTPQTTHGTYEGRVSLRVDGTAGTLSTSTSGIVLSTYPDYIQDGNINFYICYKNNYPESNQVTCEIWVYIGATYQGVNIIPMRVGTGGRGYSTSVMTWGNNLAESETLPDGYSSKIHNVSDVYAKTQTSSDNSTKVATTAFINNWVAANTSEVAVVVESWRSGTEWYKIWSNGCIEQGGFYQISSATTWVNVTLHKAMADSNYDVKAQPVGSASTTTSVKAGNNSTNTTTVLKLIAANANVGVSWSVSGQGA